jgi:zinc transport system ATP-binding protein
MASPLTALEPLLSAHRLRKRYGALEVVSDVSLQLLPGERVTIIGPNGAGKTTLLRILLGLEKPDSGEVTCSAGLRIGYVPQHFSPGAMIPLTVEGFMALSHAELGQSIEEALTLTGIAHLRKRSLYQLSGGERQRVLLAYALLGNPNLLVLDEPTQGIDLAGQTELYRLLEQLSAARNLSMLMVSHDLHFVMAATHRVICLNQHICCEGAPAQIGTHPAMTALFGPEVATRLASYVHHHDHHHTLHGETVPGVHGEGCRHD